MITKSVYEVPSLTKVGSLEAITQATRTGSRLDGNFNGSTITTPLVLS